MLWALLRIMNGAETLLMSSLLIKKSQKIVLHYPWYTLCKVYHDNLNLPVALTFYGCLANNACWFMKVAARRVARDARAARFSEADVR